MSTSIECAQFPLFMSFKTRSDIVQLLYNSLIRVSQPLTPFKTERRNGMKRLLPPGTLVQSSRASDGTVFSELYSWAQVSIGRNTTLELPPRRSPPRAGVRTRCGSSSKTPRAESDSPQGLAGRQVVRRVDSNVARINTRRTRLAPHSMPPTQQPEGCPTHPNRLVAASPRTPQTTGRRSAITAWRCGHLFRH
jgi:hypothetical protein